MSLRALYTALLLLSLLSPLAAQRLPTEIRGYRVYQARVRVDASTTSPDKRTADAAIRIKTPEVVSVGLAGISLDVGAEIESADQSGRVDFLTFKDLRINGIAVTADEYGHPFDFVRAKPAALPFPVRINVGSSGIARAAYREIIDSRSEWAVTGTVFVFGRFKKYGFTFKRVIPVPIDLKIPNPIAETVKQTR